jgi:hypothetical protein
MRFAVDGYSQINFARRIVCNPANENGDSHLEGGIGAHTRSNPP